jgi:hypothetical protein
MAGHDTLLNVKYNWSIDDLMDSHELLDIQQEREREQAERLRR